MRGFLYILLVSLSVLLVSCTRSSTKNNPRDLAQIIESDTLVVATLYGPISYFNYKESEMGYEYEFVKLLCKELKVGLKLHVAPNMSALLEMLENYEIDLVAYRVPYTEENKSKIEFTRREYISNQVLVQCKSDTLVRDVLQLSGKQVTVVPNSIYSERISFLNDEIGGGINIIYSADTSKVEDLIADVAHHRISYTFAENDIARLNKTYFGNINYDVDVSFPQRAAWCVSKNSPELLSYINEWVKNTSKSSKYTAIYQKYFEKSKYFESEGFKKIPSYNRISSYDDYFKIYSKIVGWDWRLLAAVAYKESKFDPNVTSWAGACGLMQIMPKTALSLGLTEEEFYDPEKNIQAAAKYLNKMNNLFPNISDEREKVKFVLASYNAGPGHIFDARALALKNDKNPDVWDDVKEYLRLKSNPEYYNDEVCKYGYCRGEEPINYVDVITTKYGEYILWAK
ncbi:MAG: transglycosylase SLT domain-containing protein [Paludibacteraceae bacterium]|nr:transglycosylase SLT domain-containing protein [Paludibacteraceae bacterium]